MWCFPLYLTTDVIPYHNPPFASKNMHCTRLGLLYRVAHNYLEVDSLRKRKSWSWSWQKLLAGKRGSADTNKGTECFPFRNRLLHPLIAQ